MTGRMHAMDEPRWGGPLLPEAICLDADELRQAVEALIPGEAPEQGWSRYLRALALLALRRWLKQRKASVVVGPEIRPEDPDRLLAIGGHATQLLCASSLAEEVLVPLRPWEQATTAPQLTLLALVDEDNGVVEFPGVMEASVMVAEIRKLRDCGQKAMELPVSLFEGGLERLVRWTTLLDPEALPRRGRRISASVKTILENHLKGWVESLLASDSVLIPVTALEGATRGIMPIKSDFSFLEQNRIAREIRLLSPAIVRNSSGDYVARAACARPSIWAHTSLAEIQIWKNSDLLWRQRATVDKPIQGPVNWPLEDLSPMEKLTVCLRPYGSKVGEQGVFTLVADQQINAQLNEQIIQKYFEGSPDVLTSTSEAKIEPELMAELMTRVALNLPAEENLFNDHN